MIITIIFFLLIAVWFLGTFGSYSFGVIGLLLGIWGAYAIYKKLEGNNYSGILGKTVPVSMVISGFLAVAASSNLIGLVCFTSTGWNYGITDFLTTVSLIVVAVGILFDDFGKDYGKKIIGGGLVAMGAAQTYNLITSLLLYFGFYGGFDFLGFMYFIPEFNITLKVLCVAMGAYGLEIILGKRPTSVKAFFILTVIAGVFEVAAVFAEGNDIFVFVLYAVIFMCFLYLFFAINAQLFGSSTIITVNGSPLKTTVRKTKLLPALFIILALVLTPLALAAVENSGHNYSGSTASNTCGSCHRSWSAGDSGGNYMSIAKTGMCKNCYSNFEWGMKATGKWK